MYQYIKESLFHLIPVLWSRVCFWGVHLDLVFNPALMTWSETHGGILYLHALYSYAGETGGGKKKLLKACICSEVSG